MPIKAIIFDLGGVLFENGTRSVMNYLRHQHLIEQDVLDDIFYSMKCFDLRSGKLSSSEYWNEVYLKYPMLNSLDLKTIWYEHYTLNQSVSKIVEKLKKKYILGVFSDNIPDRVEFLKRKYSYHNNFDFELYSYELGYNKLSPKSINRLLGELSKRNIFAQEVIFIDDHKDCLVAAEKASLMTLQYSNPANLEEQLMRHGVDLSING